MKEDQLREDQRREALARKDEAHAEETVPPPAPPAPQVEEPRMEAAPRVEPEQPKIDPKELLESAGLVMIETKTTAQPIAEEPQQLGRPRRERPKPQPQDEQLEQVETRK